MRQGQSRESCPDLSDSRAWLLPHPHPTPSIGIQTLPLPNSCSRVFIILVGPATPGGSRPREGKGLSQGGTACEGQRLHGDPGPLSTQIARSPTWVPASSPWSSRDPCHPYPTPVIPLAKTYWEISRRGKLWRQKGEECCQGLGEGAGEWPLNGSGFPFRGMKMFWNLLVVMVDDMVNVLDATELYVLKWLILCHVNFTSIKRKPIKRQ